MTLNDLEIRVLHPQELSGDANEDSVVLRVIYGEIDILFTGDIGFDSEEELLRMGCLSDIDVLKVAHHGSRSASSADFLDAVLPELAIYSAGVGNRYQHPHDEALARLSLIGSQVHGTDECGTIVVSTDGTEWTAYDLIGNALAASDEANLEATEHLFLSVESVGAVGQGGTATARVTTEPEAQCSIAVYYSSGLSNAQGLTPRVADEFGQASWSWIVGARTKPGIYRIEAEATLGSETVVRSVWFEVLDIGSPG
jgi:hypothetical protein